MRGIWQPCKLQIGWTRYVYLEIMWRIVPAVNGGGRRDLAFVKKQEEGYLTLSSCEDEMNYLSVNNEENIG